jgi:transposase
MHGERVPEETRWRVIFYWKENHLTAYKIAQKLGLHHLTVSALIEKYIETGTVHDRPRSGRKRKMSDSDVKLAVRMAKKKKKATQIAQALDNKVSVRTIQRRLKEQGFFYGKIQKVEKLTAAHKRKRVEYCRKMKGYKWNSVMFSDEKDFVLGAGEDYAWQRPNERIIQEYVRHAPKLHVWGAIGAYGKTELYFFEENLNSDMYVKILKSRLKENKITYARTEFEWQFLQDGHRAHTSKKSMAFLGEHMGDRLVEHPAMSPDLNPIEDIWSYLDRKVKEAKVTNIRRLKTVLTQEWRALPWSVIRKSVNSMDRRLQICIDSDGNRIPY